MWSKLSHNDNNHEGPVLDSTIERKVNAGPFDPGDLLNGTLFPVVRRYSEALKGVIRVCLAYHPDERPGLSNLRVMIARYQATLARRDPVLRETEPFGRYDVGNRFERV